MSKKIFLSLLFVLALAVSCNKNNPTSPTTTKVTYQDYKTDMENSLEGLNIATKGDMSIPPITYIVTDNQNGIDIEIVGVNNAEASSADVATKMQNALDALTDSKIKYVVTQDTYPTTETDTVAYEIVMTPRNGEFDVDSFKNEGFTDTVNTTAAKITLSINVSLIDCKWTDSYPSFKLIK